MTRVLRATWRPALLLFGLVAAGLALRAWGLDGHVLDAGERGFHVRGVRAGDLAQDLAGDGRRVLEIAAGVRGDELATDEVVVAAGKGHDAHALEFMRLVVRHWFLLWIFPELPIRVWLEIRALDDSEQPPFLAAPQKLSQP